MDSGGARGCRPPPRSAIADVYYLKSILYAGTVGAGHRVHSPYLDSPRTPIPRAPTLCALHGTGARSGTARDGNAEWRPYGMAPGHCSGYKTCLRVTNTFIRYPRGILRSLVLKTLSVLLSVI